MLDKPPPPLPAWVTACPAHLHDTLAACASADWRPHIALLDLLRAARSADEPDRILREAAQAAAKVPLVARRVRELRQILREAPDAWHTISRVLATVHGPGARSRGAARLPGAAGLSGALSERIADCARRFDRAAEQSPEASVAFYSFGDASQLARASDEILQRARAWGFIRPEAVYLDLGCGIGRMARALGPNVRRVIGLDISPRMLELARERCTGLSNVSFELASGRDLAGFATGSVGGVLAVDCFPYLVECGAALAEQLLDECRRVLEPGGQLLILNFSYRGDLDADRADMARWAQRAEMLVLRNGVRELHTWDGAAFQLLMPARSAVRHAACSPDRETAADETNARGRLERRSQSCQLQNEPSTTRRSSAG